MDTENLEYEIICGKRKNSELIYVISQKQIYKKKCFYNSDVLYICYIKHCPAKVMLKHGGLCVKSKKYVEHTHESDQEKQYKELKVLGFIKTECVKSASAIVLNNTNAMSGIRSVFRSVCERNQEDSENIQFPKIERGLRYLTNKLFIPSPKTPCEIVEAFQLESIWTNFGVTKHTDSRPFFKACLEEEDFSFCIFASENIMQLIKDNIPGPSRIYIIDATFKIVPIGCFKQLLIVHIHYFGHIYPLLFVLMSKKTERCYHKIFSYINESIFQLEPNTIMTDYERGMRNALKNLFPNSTHLACWFHYCQAIKRKCLSIQNFFSNVRKNDKALKLYHKFLALPLLPSESIRYAYDLLKYEIDSYEMKFFDNFTRYFENQWLKREKPSNISVFKQEVRTTSAVESYNGVLGRLIKKKNNFFKFVKVIRDEEFFKSRDFHKMIETGGSTGAKKKAKIRDRNAKIAESNKMLEDKQITPIMFLNRIVYEHICEDMESYDDVFEDRSDGVDDLSDDDISSNQENEVERLLETTNSENVTLCVVCQVLPPNIAMLPCKHMKICSECNLKLQAQAVAEDEEHYKCPCCREIVEDVLQVYI